MTLATLRDLKARRAALTTEMRGLLVTPAGEGGNLSAEQDQRLQALNGELDTVEQNIVWQERVEESERRIAGDPIGAGDRQLDREIRSFSLLRAIAGQVPGLNVDAGREREISAELQRRSGRPFQGIAVPMAIFQEPAERRVLTSASNSGGALIPTMLDDSQYIDRLRAAMVTRRLGARVLSGLIGNLDIPRLKASAAVGWVAENAALTLDTAQNFDKVSLTPKHAGCLVELSRNMLLQDSPDVEQLIRNDLAQTLAGALDAAAINGSGSGNQPRGILNTSGIGSVAIGTNGGSLLYEHVADLVGAIEDANAADDSVGFVSNTKVKRAAIKMTDAQDRPLGADVVWQGLPRAFTNSAPSNLTKGTGTNLSALIYANWSDLIVATWSELDLLVNPFESTAYSKGNVQVRGMMTVDIQVRTPESFAAITDIVA